MNVRKDASRSNRDFSKKLVQLLVIANSKLNVSGDDTRFLVVACCVPCELQHFGSQVLQDGGKVHRSSGTNASCIFSVLKVPTNTPDGKLKTSLR